MSYMQEYYTGGRMKKMTIREYIKKDANEKKIIWSLFIFAIISIMLWSILFGSWADKVYACGYGSFMLLVVVLFGST
jgi:hypothetical protein